MSDRLDLVAVAPDLDWELTLCEVFRRPAALSTRSFAFRIERDAMHDASVAKHAAQTLRHFVLNARYALVVVDLEGSGWERAGAAELKAKLEAELALSGWTDRSAAIVVAPELERWLWCDPRHLARAVGWPHRDVSVAKWLGTQGLVDQVSGEVRRPKEALQAVLKEARRPWSSTLFADLASRSSLKRCTDPSFRLLADCLATWFPPN